MELYREGIIHPIEPLETFDVSQLAQALRRFAAEDWMGKVAISFETPQSIIPVCLLFCNLCPQSDQQSGDA